MTMRLLLTAVLGLAGMVSLAFGQNPAPTPSTAANERVALRGAGATFPRPALPQMDRRLHQGQSQRRHRVSSGRQRRGRQAVPGECRRFRRQRCGVDRRANPGRRKPAPPWFPPPPAHLVLAYNLPDVTGTLKLSREVYADIFLGKIRDWNDPRIQALNPDLKLPKQTIILVARQDSSGTTYAMTNHLSAISEAWRKGPGVGKTVDWPGVSMTARGNEGVAGRIKRSWGSLGYVEYGFAKRLGLPVATCKTKRALSSNPI
jgi:phosphate transport system substrate-binding protein